MYHSQKWKFFFYVFCERFQWSFKSIIPLIIFPETLFFSCTQTLIYTLLMLIKVTVYTAVPVSSGLKYLPPFLILTLSFCSTEFKLRCQSITMENMLTSTHTGSYNAMLIPCSSISSFSMAFKCQLKTSQVGMNLKCQR